MPPPVPISKTKIIIPHRRSELLSRPRLLEGINALLDRKLILLSAPAGYGKTSLLIDLAHTTQLPVAWLSLDMLDREPQRFIAYLIAALAERFPSIGGFSQTLLKGLKSIERDVEGLLVALTNELYDQVEEDFLLILDDFHLVEDVPVISNLLNRFLHLLDENCHVIISSRTLPGLPDLTLMIARDQVGGLGYADLAFLPREAQALYVQNRRQYLSDETAQELVEQTKGWITGMVLSASSGVGRIPTVDAFAYFSRQVLDQQPEHLREFLLRTSIPDDFNAELCEAVIGPFHTKPQNWATLMSTALEKNLFVLPLGADGRWLRYHPLFREFLQARLREERPQEVQPILRRLVNAYEQNGEWERAYFVCKQLDDPEALAAVVEHAGTPMLQHAIVTLEGWVNSLPPAIVRSRPGLISLRGGIATLKGNLLEAIKLYSEAASMYRKNRDISGLALTLTRRASTFRLLGNYTVSMQDVGEVLRLAESHVGLQPLYAEALRVKGLDLYRLGQSRQAIESLEHSLSLYTALKEVGSIPMLMADTGMVHHAIGDIEAAKAAYQQALRIWESEKNLYLQVDPLNNLAVLYHQIGEYELASETFEKGLSCARKSRNRRAEALILTGLGDLYAEVEEFDAATQAYHQAEKIVSEFGGSFISTYLIFAKANLAFLQKNYRRASQIIGTLRKKIQTNPSSYERGLWSLIEGRICLLKKKTTEAVAYFRECKASFIEDGRNVESLWSRVWLMAALEQSGQRDAASAEFREVLALEGNPSHALLVTLRQADEWLNGLQGDPVAGHSLGSLIEKARRLEAKFPTVRRELRRLSQSIQISAASLSIRAFGRPKVHLQGRAIAMSDWRTQSVRDLFFYFLFKKDAVNKEQIGEALWSETDDPLILKARFKNEIYRLRRAAGRDVIVFDEEYYRFNRALDYEYDVEAFEAHLARARKVKEKGERIGHYQKAVDLVRGPYLADVDANWAIFERERLQQLFLSALEELAQLYLDTNRLRDSLSVCNQGLVHDHYRERFHQIAMRAHAALGDRPAMVRQYQTCKTDLQKDLGLSPSDETELLYLELAG